VLIKAKDFPSNKKVLYCCLNWGLGHATRSVPIIQALVDSNNDVTIASDGLALDYLQKEFPEIKSTSIADYKVTYPYNSLFINVSLQSFKILNAIFKEHNQIKLIHDKEKFDYVISDNRPGCRIPDCKNIFITHQLSPYHPNKLIALFYAKVHHYFYKKFDQIWVPDFASKKLSGSLSKYDLQIPVVSYIGAISRFKKVEGLEKKCLTILFSGPEPQRTIMENEVYDRLKNNTSFIINFVRGTKIPNPKIKNTDNIAVVNIIHSKDLQIMLNQTKLVVSRSGYTSILDYEAMQLDAILIPTPGQTEQEYLADLHKHKWPTIYQNEIHTKLLNLIEECMK
jgi:uncharacterized protein (TIGR00661 family)